MLDIFDLLSEINWFDLENHLDVVFEAYENDPEKTFIVLGIQNDATKIHYLRDLYYRN